MEKVSNKSEPDSHGQGSDDVKKKKPSGAFRTEVASFMEYGDVIESSDGTPYTE